MGFWSALFGGGAKPVREERRQEPNIVEVPALWGEIEVQGENFRRDAVRRLFAEVGFEHGGVLVDSAMLLREPTNRYDADAVQVYVGRWHVGYVPREISPEVSNWLREHDAIGAAPVRMWAEPRDGAWRARATLFSEDTRGEEKYGPKVDRDLVDDGEPPVEVVFVPVSPTVDLRGLESTRMRVKGVANYVGWDERRNVPAAQLLLVREPDNEFDASAVMVCAEDGRKLGYVSAARAKMFAPLLDSTGASCFATTGAIDADGGSQLWVDLPKVDALRRFLRDRG